MSRWMTSRCLWAPTTTSIGAITTAAARCAAIAASVVGVAALGVAASGLADETRAALGFGFDGVDRSARQIAAIALHNAKIASGVLLCAALAPRLTQRIGCSVGLILAIVLALNAATIGMAIGAYGTRALHALAPHAPLELVGLSLTGGAYMRARRQPLRPPVLMGVGCTSGALLIVAAALETYAGGTP